MDKPIPEAVQKMLDEARHDTLCAAYGQGLLTYDQFTSALTAAQQQGQAVAWSVLRIGNYGAAYDPRGACRAFTYDHQPGNVDAGRLGNAAQSAATASAGDSIDRGLALLKALQEAGFGVFQIGAAQPMQQGGGEVVAWLANDGTGRVIDAKAKAAAARAGGATASAMAAYTIPLAPPSAPVGAMTKDSRVPDDYRNQASGYRAGWNDALASDLAQQPAADEEAAEQYRKGWEAGHAAAQQPAAVDEAMRLLREYRKAPKFSNDHDAIKRTVALEDEIDAFLATQHQEPTT